MLTSKARDALRGVDTVIVDEVHALAGQQARRAPGPVAGTAGRAAERRRPDEPGQDEPAGPAQRIGLSATVRPPEEVATFLGGARPVTIAAPPSAKQIELQIVVPVEDMTDLGSAARRRPRGARRRRASGEPDLRDAARASGRSGRTSRSRCST